LAAFPSHAQPNDTFTEVSPGVWRSARHGYFLDAKTNVRWDEGKKMAWEGDWIVSYRDAGAQPSDAPESHIPLIRTRVFPNYLRRGIAPTVA